MTRTEQIDADIRVAMKAGEKEKVTFLRNFKSALKYREIDKKGKLDEAEEIAVLTSLAKKLRESIDQAHQAQREDLVQKNQVELDLLTGYLPEQVGPEKIEEMARGVIAQSEASGPGDIGRVMKELMPRLKGQADGSLVKQVVQRLLSN